MKQKGFSLIEVLIVMAILSTIAVLAVPAFTYISDKMLLQREAAILVSELRYLREISMNYPSQNANFSDVPGDVYPVFRGNGDEYYILLNRSVHEKHKMPKGMRITGDITKVSFSVFGTAYPLTLKLYYNGQWEYVIIDVEGRIRASDKPSEE